MRKVPLILVFPVLLSACTAPWADTAHTDFMNAVSAGDPEVVSSFMCEETVDITALTALFAGSTVSSKELNTGSDERGSFTVYRVLFTDATATSANVILRGEKEEKCVSKIEVLGETYGN